MYKNVLYYKLILILLVSLALYNGIAQESKTISGTIIDNSTLLPIGDVQIISEGKIITISDSNGFFSITKHAQHLNLIFRHLSYQIFTLKLNKSTPPSIQIKLTSKVMLTNEIEVTSSFRDKTSSNIDVITLQGKELDFQPKLFGESDVMRSIMALPGVQSVNEGISGVFVRGGNPGQNTVYFDGIELLNPYHLLGSFSVFNPILTDKVTLYKGNAPSDISTKLSSTIKVETKTTSEEKHKTNFNIGTLASNIVHQYKSDNNKWYFNVGARRTSLEAYRALANYSLPKKRNYFNQAMYSFYDLNSKLVYTSQKGRAQIALYKGRDVFDYSNGSNDYSTGLSWGNSGVSLSYEHQHTIDFTSKYSITYNEYNFRYGGNVLLEKVLFQSQYKRLNAKIGFSKTVRKHLITYGSELTNYWITPQFIALSDEFNSAEKRNNYNNIHSRTYMGDEFQITKKLNAYLGASFNIFSQLGPYSAHEPSGNIAYKKNEIVKNYFSIAPTLKVQYDYEKHRELHFSITRRNQFVHLGNLATVPLPADVWMPSTKFLKPQNGVQATFGGSFTEGKLSTTMDFFYRSFKNQLAFTPSASETKANHYEENFQPGNAASAGFELLTKYSLNKVNLQLSYTYSKVKQKYETLNNNEWFDAKHDRPHDLNLVLQYNFKPRLTISANWVFTSGNKTTLPEHAYWQMGYLMYYTSSINNYRYPPYHRLDVSLDYKLKSKRLKESTLSFSIINVYNRANPYFIYYLALTEGSNYWVDVKAKQVSLFPILPSISWRASF